VPQVGNFSNFSQNENLDKNLFIGVEFKIEFQNRSTYKFFGSAASRPDSFIFVNIISPRAAQ
jgi:hypothetical protein